MFILVKDSKNYKSIFGLPKIFLSLPIVFHQFPWREEERRSAKSWWRAPRAREQGITLEVDRRISFSIVIRAWEEFISVANVPHTRILYSRNKLKRSDW